MSTHLLLNCSITVMSTAGGGRCDCINQLQGFSSNFPKSPFEFEEAFFRRYLIRCEWLACSTAALQIQTLTLCSFKGLNCTVNMMRWIYFIFASPHSHLVTYADMGRVAKNCTQGRVLLLKRIVTEVKSSYCYVWPGCWCCCVSSLSSSLPLPSLPDQVYTVTSSRQEEGCGGAGRSLSDTHAERRQHGSTVCSWGRSFVFFLICSVYSFGFVVFVWAGGLWWFSFQFWFLFILDSFLVW